MDRKPHILEDFELELQSLRGGVLAMGRTAQEMVEWIGLALQERQAPDAAAAKRSERELDQGELEIDEQARNIMMRYQPVATDLREVTGAVRMATDLEQIGDDAKRLLVRAEQLQAWIAGDADRVLEELWRMSRKALAEAFEAFQAHDAARAEEVRRWKKGFRRQAEAVRAQVSRSVCRDGRLAPLFVEAVGAAHLLERIGLHACSLAETVYFIETASHLGGHGKR